MSDLDILLVAGMASLAVVITLVDLFLSFYRHRRRMERMRKTRPAFAPTAVEEARREAIRGRLAAIQATMPWHEAPAGSKTKAV
jgi:hypothetical protein